MSEWFNMWALGVQAPLTQSLGTKTEEIGSDFAGIVRGAYKANGVVFACMLGRMTLFSEARFQFQRMRNGRPGDLFANRDLKLLETPWPNGTTGDLLTRMIQDADLSGNWYGARRPAMIQRLQPDWVTIIMGSKNPDPVAGLLDTEVLGYSYKPGGPMSSAKAISLLREEVAHFAPIPDPAATYRGMSWLTPVVREIMGDQCATEHKLKFFEQGAPQPLDARLMTPTGWKTMGCVAVGDRVLSADGRPRTVVGVYPQGEKPIYRVKFSGGGETECSDDHLWQVTTAEDRRKGSHRLLTLGAMLKSGINYPSGTAKWAVPLPDPLKFDDPGPRPIDPYLMGLLLGDGSFRANGHGSGGVSLAVAAEDVEETLVNVTDAFDGVTISRRDRGGWSELYFKGPGGARENPLTRAIKNLGLWDLRGSEKFIPDVYMRAPIAERVALLQGLIDSDGHVDKRQGNVAAFTSTSGRLAGQVRELALGLGGTASCCPATPRPSRPNGPLSRPQWRVRIRRLPSSIVPCKLERKRARYTGRVRGGRYQHIKSVEFIGSKPAQCIKIDDENGLYLTDDMVVTHNTPNLVVTLDATIQREAFERWVEMFSAQTEGMANAYKNLYLGAGATAQPVGADLKQVDFKVVQGAGESRIAAAAGMPPIIVGLSEGLAASTYSNFGSARRLLADKTLRPLWRGAAGALSSITSVPSDARLWYDARDISFLQEDVRDDAEIQSLQSVSIRQLIDAGFRPDSVVDAINAGDFTRLDHTGLFSVQLQEPGTQMPPSARQALLEGAPVRNKLLAGLLTARAGE